MNHVQQYVALLRGVNVGGKAKLKMADVRLALLEAGLENVSTYIQSGNVLFSSSQTNTIELAVLISTTIHKRFGLDVAAVVLTKSEWTNIIQNAPTWWGSNPEWKHNLLILLRPYDMDETMRAIGTLKPDIEAAQPGDGVVYQSMSIKLFGRTTTGKIAASPVYQKMTVRSYNTANTLLALLNQSQNRH